MKVDKLWQQGDVLLHSVEDIPAKAEKTEPKNGQFTLAIGEATGHSHTIDTLDTCEMFKDEAGVTWLSVLAPTTVRHQEHKAVTVPKGKYRIGLVREADPFEKEIRAVKD
jgi:hypothetical protein